MLKRLLTFVLLLASTCANAAIYDCIPSGLLPQLGEGTGWRTTTTAAGFSKAWWCALPVRQNDLPNKVYWARQIFPVHKDDLDLVKFAGAAARVAAAADPKAQADAEVLAAQVAVTPGSLKAYEYQMLKYTACKDLQLQANWPAGVVFDPKPTGVTYAWVTEEGWCGAVPVLPPAYERRVVQRNGPDPAATRPTFPVVNGVRSKTSNGTVPVNINASTATPTQCACEALKVTETTVGVTPITTVFCSVKGLVSTVAACVVPYQ